MHVAVRGQLILEATPVQRLTGIWEGSLGRGDLKKREAFVFIF